MSAPTIAVIAFDQISPFHLSIPCTVFGQDWSRVGAPAFQLVVCSAEGRKLATSAGFRIETAHGLEALQQADTIIVPSWRNGDEPAPPALLAALRAAHARGARLVGLCLGSFVLAEAGLLDGKSATTHWLWAQSFAQRFPQVHVNPNVLYVDDGGVLTSAGTAAALDCCLHLLRLHCGAEITNRVARYLVVPPHRQGGQAQYIEQPLPASANGDRLSEILHWAAQHLQQAHTLDTLAERALMSRRTFTRRFKQLTGTTVGKWLLSQRLALAQRLLESTDQSVDLIASGAGFGSAVSLRQHFATAFRTSPSHYRREFRGIG
jgi:transcriptional regulator GlxA family with amidase domain